MKKFHPTPAAGALCSALSAFSANAADNPISYGPAAMQCSTITNVFKGQTGQLAIISYMGGFVTAANVIGDDGDILNGNSLNEAATSLIKYCKTHRGEKGDGAIMHVLKGAIMHVLKAAMKE